MWICIIILEKKSNNIRKKINFFLKKDLSFEKQEKIVIFIQSKDLNLASPCFEIITEHSCGLMNIIWCFLLFWRCVYDNIVRIFHEIYKIIIFQALSLKRNNSR